MDIQQNIFKYFQSNPNLHILFVFNNMFVLDDLASMTWPEDYEYVVFDGKFFETKYRLENELANKHVILCFPDMPSPMGIVNKETFPLLDLLCANMEYMTDAAASYIQQHHVPTEFEPFVRKHIEMLPTSRFASLIEAVFAAPDASVEMANRALLSGFLGENHTLSWHEVFLSLILLETDNATAKKNAFYRWLHNPQNNDILQALQAKWHSIFNFDYSPNSENRIEDLACSLKYNSITQQLTQSPTDPYAKKFKVVNSVALDEINHIMELSNALPSSKKTVFTQTFRKLSEKIRDKSILQAYGYAEYFYYTPELAMAIISNLLETVATQYNDAIAKLSAFHNTFYLDDDIRNLIAFALHLAYYYRSKANTGKLKLNKPEDYILQYTTKYYLLDAEYRLTLQYFNSLPAALPNMDDCIKAKTNLDLDYAQIANQINLEWVRCLQESGQSLNELPLPHQQDFFKGIVNQTTKYVVIVSDAFRYEVAQQLSTELVEEKHPCSLNFALAQLPTETKFCIPTLLPHDSMQLVTTDSKPDITLNGKVRNSKDLRTELLQQYNPDAQCYTYNELKGIGSKALRETLKRPLSYIFHNVVDSLGHDGSSISLPQACDSAIKELKGFITTLLSSANITNVILTADHGFLYNNIAFEEKDKFHVDEENLEKTSRYYLTKSSESVLGIAKFPFTSVHGASDASNMFVAVPEGTNRLANQGTNYQFAHGGASLQELIIPVLSAKHVDKEGRDSVSVELLSKDIKVVSGRTRIEIYQADPVSDEFRERKITVALYDGNRPLTAIKQIELDKTSSNPGERIFIIDLMLTAENAPNLMQLRIYDTEDMLNPLKTASVTNNTLIERDFF